MTLLTMKLFEQRAQALDKQGSAWNLHEAISELAAWIDLGREKFTDDDLALLAQIGGVLYLEGSRRRQA